MSVCILSCGRSGTVYTATVLNKLGLDVGHEVPGKDGTVGAIFWKGFVRNLSDYDHVIHQVRNPVDVISSFVTAQRNTEKLYCRDIGFADCYLPTNKLESSMLVWLLYTNWADRHSRFAYQVEDMPEAFPGLCQLFGLPKDTPLPEVSTTTHSRPHEKYGLEDMADVNPALTEMVRAKIIQYGYQGEQDE